MGRLPDQQGSISPALNLVLNILVFPHCDGRLIDQQRSIPSATLNLVPYIIVFPHRNGRLIDQQRSIPSPCTDSCSIRSSFCTLRLVPHRPTVFPPLLYILVFLHCDGRLIDQQRSVLSATLNPVLRITAGTWRVWKSYKETRAGALVSLSDFQTPSGYKSYISDRWTNNFYISPHTQSCSVHYSICALRGTSKTNKEVYPPHTQSCSIHYSGCALRGASHPNKEVYPPMFQSCFYTF